MKREDESPDWIIYREVAYEFLSNRVEENNQKIPRLLKKHELRWDLTKRIEKVREIRKDLWSAIHSGLKSKYWTGKNGYYAAPDDFDQDQMTSDLIEKYDDFTESDIRAMVGYSVYLFHLR